MTHHRSTTHRRTKLIEPKDQMSAEPVHLRILVFSLGSGRRFEITFPVLSPVLVLRC